MPSPSQFSFQFGDGELSKLRSNGTPVILLLFSGGPFDVAWFVGTVVVDAVKRTFRRTFSDYVFYVRNKIVDVVPTFANRNPAPTVIFISWIFWVVASIKHIAPNIVKIVFIFIAAVAVSVVWIVELSLATAGISVVATKVSRNSNTCLATIALTQPTNTVVFVHADRSDRNQSTKTLICDIDGLAHWTAPTGSREVARLALIAPPRCA